MKTYGELAGVYDRLMEHVDFPAATAFYLKLAQRTGWQGSSILDLACGTGNIMLELLKKGFSVTGLDSSAEMLAIADQKVFKAGFTPKLICQDMRKLKVQSRFDLVICTFDSLNYILHKSDLGRVFTAVNNLLSPRGLFLFDVHSEFKMKEILGDNTFTYEGEDLFYVWRNCYESHRKICSMKLDIMLHEYDDLYRRIEEFHKQRYYPARTIANYLRLTGFQLVTLYGDWKMKRPTSRTERLFFIARKHLSSYLE